MYDYHEPVDDDDNNRSGLPGAAMSATGTGPDDAFPYLDDALPYVDYSSAQAQTRQEETPAAAPEADIISPQQSQRAGRHPILYSIAAVFGALLVIFAGTYTLLLRIHARSTPARTAVAASHFQYAHCPFVPGSGIVEGKQLRCGYLTVPEDASLPEGKTIQLAVAIFKAPGTATPADPLIYLSGGPGGGLLDDVGVFIDSSNLEDFTMGHDLILLDQRGTGYSRPALDCPELDPLSNYPGGPVLAGVDCHDRLLKAGINVQAYTTIADATDVHDLIHALGYRQADLYGVSYGTRLALTVMRLFPADIRSVILDSTVPTQLNAFTQEPFDLQHALDVLFHGCAASPSCNAEYPHLDSVFYGLVARLNAQPKVVTVRGAGTLLLNGDNFAQIIFSAMYDTPAIPLLPQLIMQVDRGDYHSLSDLASVIPFGPSNGISDGMYYAVECGEDIGFVTESELDQAITVLRPQLRLGFQARLLGQLTICQDWHQPLVPATQKQPVVSSVPTLILSGEYDPITPPSNGRLAAQTLSHSYFFLFPATGHGVFATNICPDTIMIAFLQQPATQPDGSCLAAMQEPAFE
jgi:pimeloyl-ACP methyl ester carboxylesterase